MGSKSSDKCPYKRKPEEDLRQKSRKHCVATKADWSNAAVKSRNASSHHKLEEAKNTFFLRASRGSVALPVPYFGFLASTTMTTHFWWILLLFGFLFSFDTEA
jgi:hypothetical protein